jgi:hypothetical protein
MQSSLSESCDCPQELSQQRYLKAVVKESMRILPPALGNIRDNTHTMAVVMCFILSLHVKADLKDCQTRCSASGFFWEEGGGVGDNKHRITSNPTVQTFLYA